MTDLFEQRLRAAVRELPVPAAPDDLIARVIDERARGERIILPTGAARTTRGRAWMLGHRDGGRVGCRDHCLRCVEPARSVGIWRLRIVRRFARVRWELFRQQRVRVADRRWPELSTPYRRRGSSASTGDISVSTAVRRLHRRRDSRRNRRRSYL